MTPLLISVTALCHGKSGAPQGAAGTAIARRQGTDAGRAPAARRLRLAASAIPRFAGNPANPSLPPAPAAQPDRDRDALAAAQVRALQAEAALRRLLLWRCDSAARLACRSPPAGSPPAGWASSSAPPAPAQRSQSSPRQRQTFPSQPLMMKIALERSQCFEFAQGDAIASAIFAGAVRLAKFNRPQIVALDFAGRSGDEPVAERARPARRSELVVTSTRNASRDTMSSARAASMTIEISASVNAIGHDMESPCVLSNFPAWGLLIFDRRLRLFLFSARVASSTSGSPFVV